MCGIIGFSQSKPTNDNIDILHALVDQAKIRGLHSFGYSYCDPQLKTVKEHNLQDIDFPKSSKIIYHNRYSTSGDYLNHTNNQPIQIQDVSMAFNGVIDMRTKKEMEMAYRTQMSTENDGEVLIRMCGADPGKITEFVKSMRGSFAGLFLTKDNTLLAIRNKNRPLWRLGYNNATFFASTRDIFKRVNQEFEPQQLEPYIIYES